MAEATSYDVQRVANQVASVVSAVAAVDMRVKEVGGRVEQLSAHQMSLQQQLGQLAEDFHAFVKADGMQKALQLAETRLVKVRQERETTHGHYRIVRRRATGILQAMDAALVTHDSIQDVTEETMLTTPGYWLAPGLVALGSWVRDDRDVADRALAEALRRDDHKTSLFFALVLRRYGREQPSAVWVKRYFSRQDPTALDRETMIVLDAVTNGGFGPVAQALTRLQLESWLEQLSAELGFADAQRDRWHQALLGLQRPPPSSYTYLPKHCTQWPVLADRLQRAHLHGHVAAYFHDVFDGEIPMSPRLADQVDMILESLVTNYDEEELPLRKLERELQLIVESDGDKHQADLRFRAEVEAFDTEVSFAALLTNAAMHSEQSGASPATQRFAIALSHEWIVDAYDKVAAEGRTGVPESLTLDIDGWSGTTTDGSNETALVSDMRAHYSRLVVAARDDVKLPPGAWVGVVGGGIAIAMGLIALVNWFLLLIGGAGVAYWYLETQRLDQRRDSAEKAMRDRERSAGQILKASLAEVVDYREEWATEDSKAEEARVELAAITPSQHVKAHDTDARGVMLA